MSRPENDAEISTMDSGLSRRSVLIGGSLCAAAGLALALKPETLVASSRPTVDLNQVLPTAFGNWTIDTTVAPIAPSPDVVQKIEKIYDATLARSYMRRDGARVMLSVAYGGDQSGRLRVHRPEACYSAQGFHVKVLREEPVSYGPRRVEVKRLMSSLGGRREPITYWIRVGEGTVASNVGQRIVQLQYSMTGQIPDGLIFRVSNLDSDPERSFKLHDEFIRDLFAAISSPSMDVLAGAKSV